jgi:hypothetical protein
MWTVIKAVLIVIGALITLAIIADFVDKTGTPKTRS